MELTYRCEAKERCCSETGMVPLHNNGCKSIQGLRQQDDSEREL